MVKKFFKKTRILTAAAVMVFAIAATSVTIFAGTKHANAAASCTEHADKVNIIYKGIDCGTLQGNVDAFKSKYNTNKSGHSASPSVKKDYTDLQTVYNWAGASKSLVDGMTAKNTAMGTLYKDGHITVNGETVATDAYVTARFSGPSGFTKVTGNVYARKTTTSFAQSSAKVLVVYKANGQVAFAVMVDCGNAIKVTPKPPKEQPKPVYSCDLLTLTKKTDTEYNFSGKASAQNATITGYTFDFGDGQNKTVSTSATSANTSHTYAKPGTYKVVLKVLVSVNGKTQTVTNDKCTGTVTVPTPVVPVVSCDSLAFNKTGENTYAFTAKATAKDATIVSYVFDYGDQKSDTVTTAAATANSNHSYAKAGDYSATVSVNMMVNGKAQKVTAAKCAVQVKIAQPECKPGIPVGDERCEETPVMSCDQLVFTPNATNNKQFTFTVKATAQNAVINSYLIDFGDSTPVYEGANSTIDHSYAKAGTYTVKASVKVTAKGQTQVITGANCAGTITIAQPECKPGIPEGDKRCVEECKPGVPMGDTRCNECKPGIPVGDIRCVDTPTTPPVTPQTPTVLPNTGAGNFIGLFSGFSIAGTAAHRLISRRRNS